MRYAKTTENGNLQIGDLFISSLVDTIDTFSNMADDQTSGVCVRIEVKEHSPYENNFKPETRGLTLLDKVVVELQKGDIHDYRLYAQEISNTNCYHFEFVKDCVCKKAELNIQSYNEPDVTKVILEWIKSNMDENGKVYVRPYFKVI